MVRLSNFRYEQIKRIVVRVFENHGVRSVPISGFEIANRMGISVIPYSAFTPSKRALPLALARMAFPDTKTVNIASLIMMTHQSHMVE